MQPDTNWRDLPAGPELDALVAERVLGWTRLHQDVDDCSFYGLAPDEAEHAKKWNREAVLFECNTWSADRGAAWEVVEAMEARGYHLQLTDEWMSYPRWRAEFRSLATTRPGYTLEKADTAPLAVCRAALAALEAAS